MKSLLISFSLLLCISLGYAQEGNETSLLDTMRFIRSKVDAQTKLISGPGVVMNSKFGFSFETNSPCDVEETISSQGAMTNSTGTNQPLLSRGSRRFKLKDVDRGGMKVAQEPDGKGYELALPAIFSKKFLWIDQDISDQGEVKKEAHFESSFIYFFFSDEDDAQRVKKAFEYAIPMCGGKSLPF